jgi:hypothetical protein
VKRGNKISLQLKKLIAPPASKSAAGATPSSALKKFALSWAR